MRGLMLKRLIIVTLFTVAFAYMMLTIVPGVIISTGLYVLRGQVWGDWLDRIVYWPMGLCDDLAEAWSL